MQLDWPNPDMNVQLEGGGQSAQEFMAQAVAAGYKDGKLYVNTMQTIPGEVVNMVPVDSNGQPIGKAIPGWPTGNFPAAFCCQFPNPDPLKIPNIGLLYLQMRNGKLTAAEALAANGIQPS
jgi:hypothetical protein